MLGFTQRSAVLCIGPSSHPRKVELLGSLSPGSWSSWTLSLDMSMHRCIFVPISTRFTRLTRGTLHACNRLKMLLASDDIQIQHKSEQRFLQRGEDA